MGEEHPECPTQLGTIEGQLISSGLMVQLRRHDTPLATIERPSPRLHRGDPGRRGTSPNRHAQWFCIFNNVGVGVAHALMALIKEGYTRVTQQVQDVAVKYGGMRMMSVLESLYHLRSLAHSAETHIRALSGI
jgi:hypothetical protein